MLPPIEPTVPARSKAQLNDRIRALFRWRRPLSSPEQAEYERLLEQYVEADRLERAGMAAAA
jgi:hypothetical protein